MPSPRGKRPARVPATARSGRSAKSDFDDVASAAAGGRGGRSASPRRPWGRGPPPHRRTRAESAKEKSPHEDGAYGSHSANFGRYQNVAQAAHMLTKLCRLSSGGSHTVDWQLGLRGDTGRKPDQSWRRYFTRPQQSFDAAKENCSAENQAYQTSPTTPVDHGFDRDSGAIQKASIRDSPANFLRSSGCEGSQAGQWQHFNKVKPQISRYQLQHHTTLRETPGEDAGNRINDNRSDACWVEMLGKKHWEEPRACNPRKAHPAEGGDLRMHHQYYLKVETEPDEEARKLRICKTPRRDEDKIKPKSAPRRTPAKWVG